MKAWFANKRNRSSRTPGIVKKKCPNNTNNSSSSTNTKQTYTTCPTTASINKPPLIPESTTNKQTKLVDVDIIKPEKNENSTQILTLLNGPIMLQSAPNSTDINTTQVKKAPKRKISKAASASLPSNNKAKKPIKIQPMIQPRPAPLAPIQSIMPLTVDSPGQFKTNKSHIHLVPIQPNTPVVTPPMQYYHSLPEPMPKPMSFVHAPPNLPGYSMDTNNNGPSQSPANQILDENAYQQTMTQHYHQQQQQMFQPIQSRPMQAQQKMQQKHQLQIQLQQLVHQKQQQQLHQQQFIMQQQTHQQNPK